MAPTFDRSLQNYYLECRPSEKLVQLTRIIAHEIAEQQSSQFIVYFATCACVEYFYRVSISPRLRNTTPHSSQKYSQILPSILPGPAHLFSIHGHLPPAARSRSLSAFSSSVSTPAILLATDVAARGLDLPHVDTVIQFDPPSDPKAFSHRCGRTARAGRSGRAWVLLSRRETAFVGG
jgi:ATP-dependent RNA helicase DDX55/SPB4